MAHKVAILGGGVAGMSAAHELAGLTAQGIAPFEITVYERNAVVGGKARSFPKPETGSAGRSDLPGEHGFRFFPSYYRNLPDAMSRIPYGSASVLDNLVPAIETHFARTDGPVVRVPAQFPKNLHEMAETFQLDSELKIPFTEALHFARKLVQIACACDARRYTQYETQSWFDFTGAGNPRMSPAYIKYLADGLNRRTVAASGKDVSARTVGITMIRIVRDWSRPNVCIDRVLNGPTSDRWITPWRKYLENAEVRFEVGAEVAKLEWDGDRITAGVLEDGERIVADSYISAVPLESMQDIVERSGLRDAFAGLDGLFELSGDRMNGIQFYLDCELPLAPGHVIYVDSEFSLTSISQRQFWDGIHFHQLGSGQVQGILSVDISDWDTPCRCHGIRAKDMTRQQIKDEVWRQVVEHVNVSYGERLSEANLIDWFLDPAIVELPDPDARPRTHDREQLFINRVDSWDHRPDAVTALENLYLAADYVKSDTDLATMEAANEAARRAVRGILGRLSLPEDHVEVFNFPEPVVFKTFRDHDVHRFPEVTPFDAGHVELLGDPEIPEEWGPEPPDAV